jgi:hypothetical protein
MVMSGQEHQQFHAGASFCCVSLLTMFLSGIATIVAADEGETTTVYRSVSPEGVVSFSDVAHPSAVPIEVTPPAPARKEDQERAAELFDQQLRMLEILEASRQARAADALAQQRLDLDYVRTQAALERTRALEEQNENTYYPFVYPFWFPPQPFPPVGPHPPHGGRPGGPPPPERPPSQHVRLP